MLRAMVQRGQWGTRWMGRSRGRQWRLGRQWAGHGRAPWGNTRGRETAGPVWPQGTRADALNRATAGAAMACAAGQR